MICECCDRARGGTGYPVHDPLCIYCGARYWKSVGAARTGKRLVDWREHIVKTWSAYHDTARMLALAKAGTLIQPEKKR